MQNHKYECLLLLPSAFCTSTCVLYVRTCQILAMQTDKMKCVEVCGYSRNYREDAVHKYLMFWQRASSEKYKIDLHTPKDLRGAGRCLTAKQASTAASVWLKILRKHMGKLQSCLPCCMSYEAASIMCCDLLLPLFLCMSSTMYTRQRLLMVTDVMLTWDGMSCSVVDPRARSDCCHWQRPQHRS